MEGPEYQTLKNVQYGVVAKDPDWYQAFPDVEIAADGTYVCVYRRSIGHLGMYHTIMITKSPDGLAWSAPKIFANPRDEEEKELWNCPIIQRHEDNTLEVICDYHDLYLLQDQPCIFAWKSKDNGEKWIGPKLSDVYGIMPTDYVKNPANPTERIIGLHYREVKTQRLKHVIYRSDNDGESWWSEEVLASDGVHDYCEAALVPVSLEYGGSTITAILAFIRDNTLLGLKGSPMQLSISFDFARSWSTPITIPIMAHRPIAKILADGRLLITYRDVGGNNCTALWVAKINTEALKPHVRLNFNEVFQEQKYYAIDYEESGTSIHDYGYSGWTQDPDTKNIVVVYYSRKEADNCYIKSAKFDPSLL